MTDAQGGAAVVPPRLAYPHSLRAQITPLSVRGRFRWEVVVIVTDHEGRAHEGRRVHGAKVWGEGQAAEQALACLQCVLSRLTVMEGPTRCSTT